MEEILYFFLFCGSFLPFWIRIQIRILNVDPDPDPVTQINTDPCGSGSLTLETTEENWPEALTLAVEQPASSGLRHNFRDVGGHQARLWTQHVTRRQLQK
jgi:hypothetical protein